MNNISLEKYGLTSGDSSLITWAEKAGLVETKGYFKCFGRITQAGRDALEKAKA